MTEKEFMVFFEQHFGLDDDEEILNLIVKELYCKEREYLAERIRYSRHEEPSPIRGKDIDALMVMQRSTCATDCGAYVFGQDLTGGELCSVCERRLSGEDRILEKHQALSQSLEATVRNVEELVKEVLILKEVNGG